VDSALGTFHLDKQPDNFCTQYFRVSVQVDKPSVLWQAICNKSQSGDISILLYRPNITQAV